MLYFSWYNNQGLADTRMCIADASSEAGYTYLQMYMWQRYDVTLCLPIFDKQGFDAILTWELDGRQMSAKVSISSLTSAECI